VTTGNGNRRHWRLVLKLPEDYAANTGLLFSWLRDWLIPAILHAPVQVTLELRVPEDDRPEP
jgi:hypothetical protein